MKGKLTLLTLFFVLTLLPAQAKKVSPQKAETIAIQLLEAEESATTNTRSTSGLSLAHTEFADGKNGTRSTSDNKNEPTYYVFNKGNNNGFIIVAADDVATPILGYTTTGNYDGTNLPVNFADWADELSDQIAYAIDNNLKQTPEIKALWNDYTALRSTRAAKSSAVQPLIKTTWNQSGPYNDLCPNNSLTGCVATAMAQIMKYHNYPKSRTLTIPAYTTGTGYKIDAISATSYDWNNMLNDYYPVFYLPGSTIKGSTGKNTAAQMNAVAKLMYDCGVSVEMNYSPAGSGAGSAQVGRALVNYYNYDKGVQIKSRDYYSSQEWENMIYAELDAGRPVYYAGNNPSSGHAFICDGYNNSGYFHFNWGWGGYCDGYYTTTALNPGTGGAGSGSGTYNQGQQIIINIKPNAGGVSKSELSSNLKLENSNLARGESFIVDEIIWNKGLFNFTGEYGFALVDKNNKIVDITGKISATININTGVYAKYVTNTIPKSIAPGTYTLKFVYKDAGQADWTLGSSSLTVTVNSKPVLNISKLIFYEAIELSVENTTLATGESFQMNGYVWNCSGASFSGSYGIAIVDNNDQIISIAGERTFSLGLYSYTYLTNIWNAQIPLNTAPGKYFLRAVTKETGDSDWAVVNGSSKYVNRIPVTVVSSSSKLNSQAMDIAGDQQSAIQVYATQGTVYATSSVQNPIKEVAVYNLSGAMEYRTVTNTSAFASNYVLRAGTYIVKVKTGNGVESKKILIK